jgi:hypothetical protein
MERDDVGPAFYQLMPTERMLGVLARHLFWLKDIHAQTISAPADCTAMPCPHQFVSEPMLPFASNTPCLPQTSRLHRSQLPECLPSASCSIDQCPAMLSIWSTRAQSVSISAHLPASVGHLQHEHPAADCAASVEASFEVLAGGRRCKRL